MHETAKKERNQPSIVVAAEEGSVTLSLPLFRPLFLPGFVGGILSVFINADPGSYSGAVIHSGAEQRRRSEALC